MIETLRRLPVLATLLVAAAVATMIALGVWQLSRAAWKDDLISRYQSATTKPPIAFPTGAIAGELPLYRRASGHCLQVVGWRALAGRNLKDEIGYVQVASCRTGAEGPGMNVVAGWSADPSAKPRWTGGPVNGTIGPDSLNLLRLVSATGLGGLQASAPPSLDTIPNNHRGYAIQWFLFAGMALLIYGLALRGRWARPKDET